jgi:hypothetical protein
MLPKHSSHLLNNIRPAVDVGQGAAPMVQYNIVDHLDVMQGPPEGLASLREAAGHTAHTQKKQQHNGRTAKQQTAGTLL